MSLRKDIIAEYNEICKEKGRLLTREEYRDCNPKFTSSFIEKIFGSWALFRENCKGKTSIGRFISTKTFNKSTENIVISMVYDGTEIDIKFFNTLLNYCKHNKAELGILWGKKIDKKSMFDQDVFDLLEQYLATEFVFEKDTTCIAKDFLITPNQKNPLLNIDKISTSYKTIISGASKQYLKILPYKQYDKYRVACTTGTISEINYQETVPGQVDLLNHTKGAILLTWNKDKNRYIIRPLIYKDNCICDMNLCYTDKNITNEKIDGIVLGDLHFPEEDDKVIKETHKLLKKLTPKTIIIHDIASWRSVSHHEKDKYLDKQANTDINTSSLETERSVVVKKLNEFTKDYKNSTFLIVKSNHDLFIEKWLNDGEFIKDTKNAKLGAYLFSKYLDHQTILTEFLPKNVKELPYNANCKINGFEVGEHGDSGISGVKGSPKQFSKTFENCIIGHTHSPEIWEKTIAVGTSSKLILNYNQKGMTCWAHTHAIIHSNGTAQLIFL